MPTEGCAGAAVGLDAPQLLGQLLQGLALLLQEAAGTDLLLVLVLPRVLVAIIFLVFLQPGLQPIPLQLLIVELTDRRGAACQHRG
jgi:hypothetical protein